MHPCLYMKTPFSCLFFQSKLKQSRDKKLEKVAASEHTVKISDMSELEV